MEDLNYGSIRINLRNVTEHILGLNIRSGNSGLLV